jgi:hypothetical protein
MEKISGDFRRGGVFVDYFDEPLPRPARRYGAF